MFYWEEIAASRYPGETFDRSSEVYHRLSREYVERSYDLSIEVTEAAPEPEKEQLLVLGSKSLDHFFGHAAYVIGYDAYMADAANNDHESLRSLVEKTRPLDDDTSLS